jgi:hypothetical protein
MKWSMQENPLEEVLGADMCTQKLLWQRLANYGALSILILLGAFLGMGPQVIGTPASKWFPNAIYEVDREMVIGEYVLRHWRDIAPGSRPYHGIVTIASEGEVLVQHEWVVDIGDLSGTDITGEGNPDIIIQTFSGGAHCCFDTFLYDLGSHLVEIPIPPSPGGNYPPGCFRDLDEDGIYEFVHYDDSFAYRYCGYAGSAKVLVVLKYDPGMGYIPASPEFAYLYKEDIELHTTWAEQAGKEIVLEGWDKTSKCSVLPLILDYLYSGSVEMAWEALYRYYAFEDVEEFRADIEEVAYSSSYFALPLGKLGCKE